MLRRQHFLKYKINKNLRNFYLPKYYIQVLLKYEISSVLLPVGLTKKQKFIIFILLGYIAMGKS